MRINSAMVHLHVTLKTEPPVPELACPGAARIRIGGRAGHHQLAFVQPLQNLGIIAIANSELHADAL